MSIAPEPRVARPSLGRAHGALPCCRELMECMPSMSPSAAAGWTGRDGCSCRRGCAAERIEKRRAAAGVCGCTDASRSE
eukprot:363937-Chlamydomonas_euryale.AAC.1